LSLPDRYPAKTKRGVLLRAGPHLVGRLLCGHPLSEVTEQIRRCKPDRWCFNAPLMTEVLLLGEALPKRAYHCLPRGYSHRSCPTYSYEKLRLPVTRSDLVKAWRSGDRQTRLEVARALCATLKSSKEDNYSYAKDRACQPPTRVLPDGFSVWNGEKQLVYGLDYRPNCWAKLLMLAGFALKAGAKILVVVPATIAPFVHLQWRGQVAQLCLKALRSCGIPLTRQRQDSLLSIVRDGITWEEDISWRHGGMVVEMGPGDWVYVDANMGMVSDCTDEWKMEQAYEDLTHCAPILPGLSVFRRIEGGIPGHRGLMDLTRVNCASLATLGEAGKFQDWGSYGQIVDRLANSPVLDRLLSWEEYGPKKIPSTLPRRQAAIAILVQMASVVSNRHLQACPDRNARDLPPTRDEWLIGQLDGEEMKKTLQRLAYLLATRGLSIMDKEKEDMAIRGELLHPEVQISQPNFALAIGVLSHLAAFYGEEVGQAVCRELHQLGLDLFLLHVTAGTLLTNEQSAGQDARDSVSILADLPVTLPSSARVLGALGITEFELERRLIA
jgi:hypothetical protein